MKFLWKSPCGTVTSTSALLSVQSIVVPTIEVVDAHPLVRQFVIQSVRDEPVTFWYNHSRKVREPIPAELQPLVDKMKEVCKMQEDQAKQVYADMVDCIRQFREEFYGE